SAARAQAAQVGVAAATGERSDALGDVDCRVVVRKLVERLLHARDALVNEGVRLEDRDGHGRFGIDPFDHGAGDDDFLELFFRWLRGLSLLLRVYRNRADSERQRSDGGDTSNRACQAPFAANRSHMLSRVWNGASCEQLALQPRILVAGMVGHCMPKLKPSLQINDVP